MSVDPVTALDNGDMRHFNRYAYAYNNPYMYKDPDGRVGVAGFVIGAGLELVRQGLTGEIKNTSLGGIAGNVGKVLIAGGAGATGAGIASGVARVTTSLAVRAAANGAAGAAIGAAATAGNNAIDGKPLSEGAGTGALIGGVAGSAGSVVGDVIDAGKAALNASAIDAIPLADRNLLEGMKATTQSGSRPTGSTTVGAAAAVSNVTSNSGGVVESCGVKKGC